MEFEVRGADRDSGDRRVERINAQDQHLKEVVKAGDEAHQQARQEMKGRWMHPKKSLGWYNDVKRAFADLPEE